MGMVLSTSANVLCWYEHSPQAALFPRSIIVSLHHLDLGVSCHPLGEDSEEGLVEETDVNPRGTIIHTTGWRLSPAKRVPLPFLMKGTVTEVRSDYDEQLRLATSTVGEPELVEIFSVGRRWMIDSG